MAERCFNEKIDEKICDRGGKKRREMDECFYGDCSCRKVV